MKKVLIIEGRQTIGGGQIISLALCKALSVDNEIVTFLPGNNHSPIAELLKDYEQEYFVQNEYTRGKKKFADVFRFIKNTLAFLKLRKVIKRRNIDTVYVQHASMLPTVLLASLGMKIKVIVHLHVVYSDSRVKWLMNKMLRFHKVSLIIGVSNYSLSQLTPTLLPKSQVIYNPIQLCPRLGSKIRSGNIAIVGDVIPLKGHHVLFKAVSTLMGSYHIYVIGNIVDAKYKEKLCRDFPSVNATFTGMKNNVPLFMEEHLIDLNVIASTSPFETFSLAMVESWGQGIPTIATNDFGMRELVNTFLPKYVDTMLFDKGNSEDLMRKIVRIESDADLYQRITVDVRRIVEENFSTNIFNNQLSKLLSSI